MDLDLIRRFADQAIALEQLKEKGIFEVCHQIECLIQERPNLGLAH